MTFKFDKKGRKFSKMYNKNYKKNTDKLLIIIKRVIKRKSTDERFVTILMIFLIFIRIDDN